MAEPVDNKRRLAMIALDLFAERGFRGTSIRDIAHAAGLSISNIYHYFGNKEGLLFDILESASTQVLGRLREATEEECEPLENIRRLLKTHLELSNLLKKEAKIFFLDEEHLSPEGHQKNLQYQREILDMYRHHLQLLQDNGIARFKSISITAFNILGVVNWHLRWYRPEGWMNFGEVSEEVVDFILHGILDPAGS